MQWFHKFSGVLIADGFSQSKADYSLFTKGIGDTFIALLVYVDDILITGPSPIEIYKVKSLLCTQFMLKDLGDAKYFLGIEFSRSSKGIYMSQRKYCLQIIEDCSFMASKPAAQPMTPGLRLSGLSGDLLGSEEASSYSQLIGRLLYLQISRPNISFALHKLSQFFSQPQTAHLNAAYHVLRHLKGSAGQGILFHAAKDFQLKAFVDSDWGGCLDSRRSVTGFCIFLGNTMVSWKTKK